VTPNGGQAITIQSLTRRIWPVIQGLLLSETLLSLSYWCTVVLVAVLGGGVLRWWAHTFSIPSVPNDPWGVGTPPWIVEVSLAVLVLGCLAEACRQAFDGNRKWKCIVTTTIVVCVVGLTQTLKYS
jgi:hypothetical protein